MKLAKSGNFDEQVDLFLPQITSLPLRDQRETMERPFFSLSKRKRLKPIDYVSPDQKITVHVSANSEYGMATIYDLDILIYLASVLIDLKRQGRNDVPQTLDILPFDLLKTIRRATGGRAYELLGQALDRLQSTTVKTNIRAGDAVDSTFSWIDSYTQLREPRTGRIRGMRITLAKWFYDGVLMEGGVLSIDPEYFSLDGGRERWLYRVARKHAGGAGSDGFTIAMPTLFEKSGAEGEYRRFKFELIRIVTANDLPGYGLELVQRAGQEPMVRMYKRSAKTSKGAPSPPLPAQQPGPEPFPDYGSIRHGAFSVVAQHNLPQPQRDWDLVAQDFRSWARSKSIPLDKLNIADIFGSFCRSQKASS